MNLREIKEETQEEIEREIILMLDNATNKEMWDFQGKADWEGLVYYVQNWDTPFDNNEIYKRNLKRPFFESLYFLERLNDFCINRLDSVDTSEF